jgi:hypothetical protein
LQTSPGRSRLVDLEQQHGEQARPEEAARRNMERRWRLGDSLTRTTRKALAHRLNHLPLARDHFQRLGDVLAQLGKIIATAARAGLGCSDHHALARQMFGQFAARAPTGEGFDGRGLGGGCGGKRLGLIDIGFEIFERQLHLVDQPRRALRCGGEPGTLQLLDLQLQQGVAGEEIGVDRQHIGGFGRGNIGVLSRLNEIGLRLCQLRLEL